MKSQYLILKALLLGATINGIGMAIVSKASAQPATQSAPTAPQTAPAAPTMGATEVQILTPTANAVMDIPATSVTIRSAIGAKVELRVNGNLVDSNSIGRTETDSQKGTVTQTWYGVSLGSGESTVSARAINNGVTGAETSIKLKVRGAPKSLKLNTLETRIPADGRSLLTVEGQTIDENGNQSKQDGTITLYTTAGEFAGVDQDKDQPGFQTPIKEGKFTAKLRSTLSAQTVKIRATTLDLEAFAQAQFETNLRTPITTGLVDIRLGGQNVDYYRNFKEFNSVTPNNSSLSVRGQVFSTGRVGDWSFTGAYNSDRPLNKTCGVDNNLFRNSGQACEDAYPVYGDSSKIDILTPSQDSVYLKFERSTGIPNSIPDMGMWGDYNTTEFATKSQQLSATNRQLHGAKVNYNIGNLQASAFYGDNVQGFQRDTVPPDGTSGYYFLSRRFLLGGSETIQIETEELNRPGTILKVETLVRGNDYDIDYDRGGILLRKPLLRTTTDGQGSILTQKIIATYQYLTPGSSNSIYGGRAQFYLDRTLNQESWIGASYVNENAGSRNFNLLGADALISLSPNTNVIAEYARSTNGTAFDGRAVDGSAYRVEAQAKLNDTLQGRAYYRTTEAGFSNNATSSFIPGQTRLGAEANVKVSSSTNLRVQADRENNRGTAPAVLFPNLADLIAGRTAPVPGSQLDNDLTTLSAGIQQQFGNISASLDYVNRDRLDRVNTTSNGSSSQIRSTLSVPLTSTLKVSALNETALSSSQDSLNPSRTALGLDWNVYQGINLRLNQNWIAGGQLANTSFTSLDVDANYKVASNTNVTGRYSLNPFQSIGAVGVQQGIVLSPGLKMDLAYERIIGGSTGFVQTGAGTQAPTPFTPGQSSALVGVGNGNSYSVGLNYTDNPNFQANARYELRDSLTGSSSNINLGATGKVSTDLTALARYQQNGVANQVLGPSIGSTANLRLGLAYRNPESDKLNALLSYQFRRNPSIIPDSLLTNIGSGSEDHTFAVETIYAPDWQWELYGKYAFRNGSNFLDATTTTSNALSLGQLRATYRLGFDWDLVADGRIINQPNQGFTELGLALEAGYYLTPNLRLSAGYGFGRVDDPTVINGNRSSNGAYVGLTVKVNDLFGFGLQPVSQPQQQESVKK
jgi:hypothetical protein